jgi:hypothetical protein
MSRTYLEPLEHAPTDHMARHRAAFQAKTLGTRPSELPEINLEHLCAMTDHAGILHHAVFAVPSYEEGYCLDDNARALLLMGVVDEAGAEDQRAVRSLASRYLAFMSHAFNAKGGRFRDFMNCSRGWTEEIGSEDSHGRALWALGSVVGRSDEPGRPSLGDRLFHAALPALSTFTSPRAWAFALLGIDEYLRAFKGDRRVEAVRATLAEKLLDLFQRTSRRDWPWFEDRLTYCNACLSQALIISGARVDHEEMTAVGLRSLEWLSFVQFPDDGHRPRLAFDQQPVEASAMVSACIESRRVTGDKEWTERAWRSMNWFLGQNRLEQSLYDATTGGCRDGLRADRVNENQGAESTLSFLLALSEMRSARCAIGARAHQSVLPWASST